MSAIDYVISADILLADYVGIDTAGKLNIVGGGISSIGSYPDGMTAPFSVLVILDFKPEFDGQKFQYGLELVDLAGEPVELEGPEGKSRLQLFNEQTAGIEPNSPDIQKRQGVPPGIIPIGVRSVVALTNGIPLPSTNFYSWRLTVDSQEVPGGTRTFYVKSQEQ